MTKHRPLACREELKLENLKHEMKPKKPKKTKPKKYIRPVSKALAKQLREYAKESGWAKNHACRGWPLGICDKHFHMATDRHHSKGRIGSLLNDKRFWVPVCRKAHDWIGANPARAKEFGLILSNWNGTPRNSRKDAA